MADGRRNNGGKRKGAGRKPKEASLELISKFDKIINEEDVIVSLNKLIKKGDYNAIKLYLEYRYGKPHNFIDITSGDEPLNNFSLNNLTDKELSVLLKLHDREHTGTEGESDQS